ncbi:MAG TPA: MbnP family protein [Saprospiraceae bacterium]|nr:MbnP family protein [Saprospiraceae bacterium]
MKWFRLTLVLLVLSIVQVSCKKDATEGSFKIHYKATYDGQPLSTFTPFPYAGSDQVQFTLLTYLVSDLTLLNGNNEEALDDIELVNLSFDNPTDAGNGYTITYDKIPAKNYDGIRFGIGVPADVNQKKPADFPSQNPLSNTSYYWQAWNSFIFSKTEGTLDTLGGGSFDLGFAFHTGSDEFFRTLQGSLPINIEDGKTTELSIAVDYKKLLDGIDIVAYPINHNPADSINIKKIVNNLQQAVTLIQ